MRTGHFRQLAELVGEQWGMFTTAQARQRGVSHAWLVTHTESGELVRVRHGVYRHPDSAFHLHGTPLETVYAEWLAIDPARTWAERVHDPVPAGVVSHRTAGWMHGLSSGDGRQHYTLPQRRRSRGETAVFHTAALADDEWDFVDDLPVTHPVRTVADLACLSTDRAEFAAVVITALQRGAIYDDLIAAIRPHRHYGCQRTALELHQLERTLDGDITHPHG